MQNQYEVYQKKVIFDEPKKQQKKQNILVQPQSIHQESKLHNESDLKSLIEMFKNLNPSQIQSYYQDAQFNTDQAIENLLKISENFDFIFELENYEYQQPQNTMNQKMEINLQQSEMHHQIMIKLQEYIQKINEQQKVSQNMFENLPNQELDYFPSLIDNYVNQDTQSNFQQKNQIQQIQEIDPEILAQLPPDIIEEIFQSIPTRFEKIIQKKQQEVYEPSQEFYQKIQDDFPTLPLESLKLISQNLSYSEDHIQQFLIEYFPQLKFLKIPFIKKSKQKQKQIQSEVKQQIIYQKKISKLYENTSIQDMQIELMILLKKLQFRSMNVSQKQNLKYQNDGIELQKQLNELKQAIADKFLHLLKSQHDKSVLDLHGLMREQVDYILENYLQWFQTKHISNELTIITGRGLHSQGGKAVLFYYVENWLQDNGFEFKGSLNLGKWVVNFKQ